MRRNRSPGLLLAGAYTILCFLAISYIVVSSTITHGQFELAGMFILILGLPWSIIFAITLASFHMSSAWIAAGAMLLSCIMNGYLLYKIGSRLSWRF